MIVTCIIATYVVVHLSRACTYTNKGLKYPECPSEVSVHWYDIPPYIYTVEGNVTGIARNVTEKLIRYCCGQCVQFQYEQPFKDSNELEGNIGRNESGLTFPIYGTITSDTFNKHPYVPIVESPGIIYVTKKPYVGKASALLLKSVTDCWPILVLIFMMSAVFGIIVWATDSYMNPEQFPNAFYKGSWDGFWWSLVSMTTVGYGDKAPRGLTGRALAFVWILIGLVLYSVFSGYVSTESTAAALGSDVDLFGQNVVTFAHSQEQRFGIKSNANVTTVTTIKEFMKLINTDVVDGGLIDSYFAGVYQDDFKNANIIVGTVFDYQFTYGFVLSNNLSSGRIRKCVWKALSLEEKYIMDLIQYSMTAMPELTESELAQLSTALFDERSPIFREAVMVIGILLCFMCCCGVLWEIIYNRPRLKKLHEHTSDKDVEVVKEEAIAFYETMEDLLRAQNKELEAMMMGEINAFVNAFNRRENDFQQLLRDPSFQEMLPELMKNKDIRFVQYT